MRRNDRNIIVISSIPMFLRDNTIQSFINRKINIFAISINILNHENFFHETTDSRVALASISLP